MALDDEKTRTENLEGNRMYLFSGLNVALAMVHMSKNIGDIFPEPRYLKSGELLDSNKLNWYR